MYKIQNGKIYGYILLYYIAFISLLMYSGWTTTYGLTEHLVDPLLNIIRSSPTSFHPSIIQGLLTYLNLDIHILFLSTLVSTILFFKRGFRYLIPFYASMYIMGDYVSPLLYSLIFTNFRKDSVNKFLRGLLFIHEPLYILPFTLKEVESNRSKKYLLSSLILIPIYGYIVPNRYFFDISDIHPIHILNVIILTIYSIYLANRYGLIQVLSLLSPYSLGITLPIIDMDDDRYRALTTYFSISFISIFISLMILNPVVSPSYNSGLDNFIEKYLPDNVNVISLSNDPVVNKLIGRGNRYIIGLGDSYRWDWGNRSDVKRRLDWVLEYAENRGVKYVVLDKPRELAYWVSKKHYREYKYPLRNPLGRYIIILERRDLIGSVDGYYLSGIKGSIEYSYIKGYIKYWSNISLEFNVTYDTIEINSSQPYEIYIHFNLSGDEEGLIFQVDSPDKYIRSVEVYGYDGRLNSLWESSNKNFYYPVAIKLDLHSFPQMVFKIEDKGYNRIRIYELSNSSIYDIYIEGDTYHVINYTPFSIRLESFQSMPVILLHGFESTNFSVRNPYIYLVYILIFLISFPMGRIWSNQSSSSLSIKTRDIMIFLGLLPLILYLIHPSILEINWIGGGPFIIFLSLLIIISSVYGDNEISSGKLNIVPIILIFPYLTSLIKPISGDIFDVLNDFWRSRAIYVSLDVIIMGILSLLFSLYYSKEKVYLIPPLYLILNGSIYTLDLFKFKNPLFKLMIDLATILVKYSLEGIGYSVKYVFIPAGNALYIYKNVLLTTVILGWPCTGLTGLFLFTSFALIIRKLYIDLYDRVVGWKLILVGMLVTYLLNIARIDAILLLTIYMGIDAGEVFHSMGYELVFMVWILIYWILIHKYLTK